MVTMKDFIIIGNRNAIILKDIFTLIKENKLWVGQRPMSQDILFTVPEHYQKEFIENKRGNRSYIIKDGTILGRSQAIWFTTLNNNCQKKPLVLVQKYSPEKYPKYDNYDAIEVKRTKDIPYDYDGVMGVPITFLDKYCPEQFEIIGLMSGGTRGAGMINGKGVYARILIRKIS